VKRGWWRLFGSGAGKRPFRASLAQENLAMAQRGGIADPPAPAVEILNRIGRDLSLRTGAGSAILLPRDGTHVFELPRSARELPWVSALPGGHLQLGSSSFGVELLASYKAAKDVRGEEADGRTWRPALQISNLTTLALSIELEPVCEELILPSSVTCTLLVAEPRFAMSIWVSEGGWQVSQNGGIDWAAAHDGRVREIVGRLDLGDPAQPKKRSS